MNFLVAIIPGLFGAVFSVLGGQVGNIIGTKVQGKIIEEKTKVETSKKEIESK